MRRGAVAAFALNTELEVAAACHRIAAPVHHFADIPRREDVNPEDLIHVIKQAGFYDALRTPGRRFAFPPHAGE